MHKQNLSENSIEFRKVLLEWFKIHQREMPWRGVEDPYKIWVSEVMLQQTQVKKVVDYYIKFISRFPDVKRLASASLQEVLKMWEGLGYYARARNLHKAAKIVVDAYNGEIPSEYKAFRQLPGVGDYSAAAVLSIAYDAPYAAVDGNIKRVLARLFLMDAPINDNSSSKLFQQQADNLLDRDEPGLFNQAMMELGATVCRPQSPTCLVCPVNVYCGAFQSARQDEFPHRNKRIAVPEHHMVTGVINKGTAVLLVQRPLDGLLGGLWEFPNGRINEGEDVETACVRLITDAVNLHVKNITYLTRVKHALTHFKIVVDVFNCDYQSGELILNGPVDAKWVELTKLHEYPLPRTTHKILQHIS